CRALHGHYLRRAFDLQGDREADGDHGSNINVLCVRGETLLPNAEMVGVEGNVGEAELSRGIGRRGSVKTADRVMKFTGSLRHHGASGINHGASDGRGVTRLRVSAQAKPETENCRNSRSQRLLV